MKHEELLTEHELGFLQLADKPSLAELSDYYEKSYYQDEAASYRKEYSQIELEAIHFRIAMKERIVRSFRSEGPGKMLDVGCGEGFTLKFFKSLGWHVTGIDFSSAGVEQINPECAGYVQQGDIFQMLNAQIESGEKYDLVWLGNVLEHVLEPVELLKALRGIISPSGIAVVMVPNDANQYHENLLENGDVLDRFWIAIPDHISYFNLETLETLALSAGWDCLATQGDFPINMFLANECSNYVLDRSRGPAAHEARLKRERVIASAGLDAANFFYTALAGVGLGRNIVAYLRPR